jgi:cyanophycinase
MHRRIPARTRARTRAFSTALAAMLIALCAQGAAPAKPAKLRSWLTGNAADAARQPVGGPALLMMGGGTEVDAGLAQRAFPIANGGDIVILRTSGKDGYNDYLYTLVSGSLKPDSVETLLVDTRDKANSDYVDRAIRQAELVFLAGGDQSTYVNAWQGTRVQDALHFAHARGAVIGGTSAGLAVLGQHAYDPDGVAGVTSAEALADPYHPYVMLSTGFLRLPILDGTITDSHFRERDRMGRTLAFMARLRQDGIAPSITAVAIDEQTSLFIDRDGRGIVDSNLGGAVYVISERTDTVRERVAPGQPLVYRNLDRVRLRAGQWYDFVARTHAGDRITLSVDGRNAAPFTPADPY